MSNNNYFTNANSNNTGTAHYGFITMGFTSDGKGHAKAHINMPDMAYFKNKLLVQFAIQSPGQPIIPMGDVASVANGTFDPTTNIATLTWDGTYPGLGASISQDWIVIAGIDTNGDGLLQTSEIGAQSIYKVRAVNSPDYTADLALLVLGENTIGRFIEPRAGDFLEAFCYDTAVNGATATTTTISVNATTPQPLSVNVGALFQPNGVGSIRNNTFPSNSLLADEIYTSASFNAYITSILSVHHAEVDAYFTANPTASPQYFGPWAGPTALALTDNDLIDALDNVTANLTVTVLVSNDKKIQLFSCDGNIQDLYNFTWPDPTPSGLGPLDAYQYFVASGTLSAAMSVQAGYNTLGSGGHIFTSTVLINDGNAQNPGFTYTFQ